jgi:DNA sulfur modification protein DndC
MRLARRFPTCGSNCEKHSKDISRQVSRSVERVHARWKFSSSPCLLAFSGGKDSTCLLTIVGEAARTYSGNVPPVTVVYCDTGTEIPPVSNYVLQVMADLSQEFRQLDLPFDAKVIEPRLEDRFLVKVIGKGYPPPSNMFRWCTDRLRVWPFNQLLKGNRPCDVYIGTRWGESDRRNRTMKLYASDDECVFHHRKYGDVRMVSPIVDFSVEEVWSTITQICRWNSIDTMKLATLYRHANGECAALETKDQKPCSAGRFGCWTCTVIKSDRASEGLVENGYPELAPLLLWRATLIEVSRTESHRCSIRRNGKSGKGPLTLLAREMLLERLLKAEADSGIELITKEEIELIRKLWHEDVSSPHYREH